MDKSKHKIKIKFNKTFCPHCGTILIEQFHEILEILCNFEEGDFDPLFSFFCDDCGKRYFLDLNCNISIKQKKAKADEN